jgi:hypothetical protein
MSRSTECLYVHVYEVAYRVINFMINVLWNQFLAGSLRGRARSALTGSRNQCPLVLAEAVSSTVASVKVRTLSYKNIVIHVLKNVLPK